MIALVGDVSGHYEPFLEGLRRAGAIAATRLEIHNGSTIVQLGDLVHKGPDSGRILSYVNTMAHRYPPDRTRAMYSPDNGTWVQLLGNHEGRYIGHSFEVSDQEMLSPDQVQRLLTWVGVDRVWMAYGFWCEEYGPTLATHAGMTYEVWDMIGQPQHPDEAATRLNRLLHQSQAHRTLAFEPGCMLQGGGNPGVAWTEPVRELWPSWKGRQMPFAQIHGHASAYHWGKKRWSQFADPEVVKTAVLDHEKRHLTVEVGDNIIASIDPGFGHFSPGRPIYPLILTPSNIISAPHEMTP